MVVEGSDDRALPGTNKSSRCPTRSVRNVGSQLERRTSIRACREDHAASYLSGINGGLDRARITCLPVAYGAEGNARYRPYPMNTIRGATSHTSNPKEASGNLRRPTAPAPVLR